MKRVFLGLLLFLFVGYSALAVVRHMHFESGAYDLGIFDQTVWQYSQFMNPYSSIKDRFILGDHFNVSLALLAPLYWIWADPRMLLVFQAAWLVGSAYAIYLIGCKRKLASYISVSVASVYALFYGFQHAVIFDFHASIIGVGLVVWAAYFLECRKQVLMWVAVALLLLTQENMGIALMGLGCVYLMQLANRKTAVIWLVLGVAWTLIGSRVVGLLSPVGFEYAPILPESIPSAIAQLYDSEEKRRVWIWSFAWFAFIPVFSPGAVMAVLLDLGQYFLSGPQFARNWTVLTHHRAMLAPFLALGVLDVLGKVKHKKMLKSLVLCMLISALVLQYAWHLPLNKLVKPAFWRNDVWMSDMHALLRLVPPKVAVAAQHNLVAHLSHRKEIFLAWPKAHVATDPVCMPLRENSTDECWWLDFSPDAVYLVVDVRANQWLIQTLETDAHFQEAVANMEKRGVLHLRGSIGTARLYEVDRTI